MPDFKEELDSRPDTVERTMEVLNATDRGFYCFVHGPDEKQVKFLRWGGNKQMSLIMGSVMAGDPKILAAVKEAVKFAENEIVRRN